MIETRQRLLFPLARLCAAPPPIVDAMRVADFAQLAVEIPRYIEAMAQPD